MKDIAIDLSVDGETWKPLANAEGSSTFTLARADAGSSFTASSINDGPESFIRFDGVKAQYVRVKTAGPNWLGQIYYAGLSEVRFYRAAGEAGARRDWMLYH